MKTCTKCDEEKALDQFSKNKAKPGGLQSQCKACCAARDKARYALNSAEVRERTAAHYAANKEQHLAARKVRYQRKRDTELAQMRAWAVRNRERSREIKAQWSARNPGVINAKTARRRTARLSATPTWVDPATFEPIYKLAADATALVGDAYHVDHIVPLRGKTVCGLHVPWNLRVIPAVDNIRKGAKLIEEVALA